MKVIAREGVRVPMEHASREYITDAEVVDVPDSAYYRRRITDGDLIEPAVPVPAPSAKKARQRSLTMSSQHIAFDTIPSGIRKPGKHFECNTKLAVQHAADQRADGADSMKKFVVAVIMAAGVFAAFLGGCISLSLNVPVQVNEMHNTDYGVAFRNVYKASQETEARPPKPPADDNDQ